MKFKDFKEVNGLKTDEDVRNYFRYNMLEGKSPVAVYVCPKCDEIANPPNKCPSCGYDWQKF